ncbi:MAG: hypothetical protein KF901_16485 [Myxococcales bacterium]|nr:hypothetical protein [Myxococcales bacterium]
MDISSNVGHCGACGRTCSGSQACCSGLCVDTTSSFDHCGSCGRRCDSGTADGCSGGVCTCRGAAECFPAGTCSCIPPLPPITSGGCTGICLAL